MFTAGMRVREITEEEKHALDHARLLARAGVPIFLAKPAEDAGGHWNPKGGSGKTGYILPVGWQTREADSSVVDRWEPDWALCAVMGHTIDLMDVDPRNGGSDSVVEMLKAGLVPRSYGRQATPSGGTHDFIATMGVASLNDAYPGVDIKAGQPDGTGRGFAFLAPTRKLNKTNGEIGVYTWIGPPEARDLDSLVLLGPDGSGSKLADMINARRRPEGEWTGESWEGEWDALTVAEKKLAIAYVNGKVAEWTEKLAAGAEMEEGERDDQLRGWEALLYQWEWVCSVLAALPWTSWRHIDAEGAYYEAIPEAMDGVRTWKGGHQNGDGGTVSKASARPQEPPWWLEFKQVHDVGSEYPAVPKKFEDSPLAVWMAWKGLGGDWKYSKAFGWMWWDGRRWAERTEDAAREAIRAAMEQILSAALAEGADPDKVKKLATLLSVKKIRDVQTLVRGVVEVQGSMFDAQPDLLNCGNGVVDLRTGLLGAHDRDLLLTKVTMTEYHPPTVHPDWTQALSCLEPQVADWMQCRFGQAATGWATSDDVMPVGQGGGSNGKTTLLASLFRALGDHMTMVPEKLLRAGPNDHPTELMTLRGVRLAVIDETPEAGQLNVPRLKATLGAARMTARGIRMDNVSWAPTHSLMVMTNYIPQVAEVDKGTWRRLALVRFDKTFASDDRFRARMEQGLGGRAEAALAWVVEGARRWYEAERTIPPAPAKVVEDTRRWRGESDMIAAFLEDQMQFDAGACVLGSQVIEAFNEWMRARQQRSWSQRLLSSRLEGHELVAEHGVVYERTVALGALVMHPQMIVEIPLQARVWRGMRWRDQGL